jgi:hypothetical protein
LEAKLKRKAEEVCFNLASKYEAKIKKIYEDLKLSKSEIEKYKLEMAKNEENMKKALMRGVCALNLEAMSIFNESTTLVGNQAQVENKQHQRNPTQTEDLKQNFPTHDPVLSRKVKEYCDYNFKLSNSLINDKNDSFLSHVSKQKKSKSTDNIEDLPKENVFSTMNHHREPSVASNKSEHIFQTNQQANVINEQRLVQSKPQSQQQRFSQNNSFTSNDRVFEELFQHPSECLNTKQKSTTNKKFEVKSKVGSLPFSSKINTPSATNATTNMSLLTTSSNVFKPVLVEKHSELNKQNDSYNRAAHSYSSYQGGFTVLNSRSLSK